MGLNILVTIAAVLFFSSNSYTAVPKKLDSHGIQIKHPLTTENRKTKSQPMKKHPADPQKMKADIIEALRLPFINRIKALRLRGPEGFKTLEILAFDKSQTLTTRWRSITAMGRLAPDLAYPILQRALRSRDWFMRNASVLSISNCQRKYALKWSMKLLNDPSLMVRTSAVQTLHKIRAVEAEPLLWKKLNAPENFKRGQSLWIRKYILKALANSPRQEQRNKFVKILKDPDKELHPIALLALRKIARAKL